MAQTHFQNLEVLPRIPAGAVRSVPLLFIHGAFVGAWCWEEHFLPFFAEAGFASHAVNLSGHGGSLGREQLDTLSIRDYVADVAAVTERLPTPPVLIGHSMGGFVVQKYLENHQAAGVVLMCSVPPQGLLPITFSMLFSRPALLRDLNAALSGGQVSLDALREALFVQPVSADDLARYSRQAQPESHRAIWDMSLFNLPRATHVADRLPMLVLGAEHDHLIPPTAVTMTARRYGVTAEIFPDMGHGIMLERDWRKVAQRILDWLKEHYAERAM
jgi:non-heme chloroperoxidase